MANERNPVVVAMCAELLDGESMDGTGLDPNTALVDSAAINITHDTVGALLVCRGGAQNDGARLMARIAVVIRHVVIAKDVTRLEDGLALPPIGDRIAAGVENAVHPLRPAPQAA